MTRDTPALTINSLPDDIFREIFREIFIFCPCPHQRYWHPEAIEHTTAWQRLIHVCRRWRHIIFESPRHLDLHLHCSSNTPFRKSSNPWPEFPLTVYYTISPDEDDDDVIFALEQPDRVRRVDLSIRHTDSMIDEVLEVMQVPFPALTHLELTGPDPDDDDDELVLPDQFLGGSAPSLQHFHLNAISFPALPELLSSARGLVCLGLRDTPANGHGYISPETMIGGLDGLTSLRTLCIHFSRLADEKPEKKKRRHLDPPLRAALPSLNWFGFTGESEYLEPLIAQIDSPQVEAVEIVYLTPEVKKIRHLYQFIGRTEPLESARFGRARITFDDAGCAEIVLDRPQDECQESHISLTVAVGVDYYHVLRFIGRFADMLYNVDQLSIETGLYWTVNGDRTETSKWLAFLRIFPALESLCVSGGLAVNIASTLEEIRGETVTEVLPALRFLHLNNFDEPPGSMARYLALRRLSGCPVTVVNTRHRFNEFDAHEMREEKVLG